MDGKNLSGGHRDSAEAILDAFRIKFGDEYRIHVKNVWKEYTGWPLNDMERSYKFMVKHVQLWKVAFHGTSPRWIHNSYLAAITSYYAKEVEAALMEYKPDIIISVHPLMQHIPLLVLKWKRLQKKVIFVTVITDLNTYHPKLVSLFPPTEAALLDWATNLMADVVQVEYLNKMNARNVVRVFASNMIQMSDPLTALMYAVQVSRQQSELGQLGSLFSRTYLYGYRLLSGQQRFKSSYVGSLARRVRDAYEASEVSHLRELYHKNDPETVIMLFESQPSLHSNRSALFEYVKALVKGDRLDESELLKTLQRGIFKSAREEASKGGLSAL